MAASPSPPPVTTSARRRKECKANRLVERLEQGTQIRAVEQEPNTEFTFDEEGRKIASPKEYVITLEGANADEVNPGHHVEVTEQATENQKKADKSGDVTVIEVKRDVLGSGGFGVVTKATMKTKQSELPICLKQSIIQIAEGKHKDTAKSLEREYRNFKILNPLKRRRSEPEPAGHQNIIQFLFFCAEITDDSHGQVFIGLEYFHGDDLSECIHTLQDNGKTSFTYDQMMAILNGVVEAIKYMEEHNLIHCDIKPHNVLFNVQNLQLKLIDFGCAVKTDEVRKERLGGTTEYMAPEVIRDDLLDTQLIKADIYGIGALMYRVITFERPWHHLEELRQARHRNCGGHHKAVEIITEQFKRYVKDCVNAGTQLATALQENIKLASKEYYKNASGLCDLVYEMLQFSPHDRPKIEDLITAIPNMRCRFTKQICRMDSEKSTSSLESSGSSKANIPITLFSDSTNPTSVDSELHQRHSDRHLYQPVEESVLEDDEQDNDDEEAVTELDPSPHEGNPTAENVRVVFYEPNENSDADNH